MIEIIPVFKELAAFGVTPAAAIALVFLFKLNKAFNSFDKRLSLLEQTTTKCKKC